VDAQAGLDPCLSQMHYVGFVVTRLNYNNAYGFVQGNELDGDSYKLQAT
jgi:hypothetical protein